MATQFREVTTRMAGPIVNDRGEVTAQKPVDYKGPPGFL